jgi:hypothetical protein
MINIVVEVIHNIYDAFIDFIWTINNYSEEMLNKYGEYYEDQDKTII